MEGRDSSPYKELFLNYMKYIKKTNSLEYIPEAEVIEREIASTISKRYSIEKNIKMKDL